MVPRRSEIDPPPSAWGLANEAAKDRREMRLSLKADAQRGIDKRDLMRREKGLGTLDTAAQQIFARTQAGGGSELCREVHAREPGGRSHVGQQDRCGQIGFDEVGCLVQPPFGKRRHRSPMDNRRRHGRPIGSCQ